MRMYMWARAACLRAGGALAAGSEAAFTEDEGLSAESVMCCALSPGLGEIEKGRILCPSTLCAHGTKRKRGVG